jgi:phosphoadenosine phosphosulfate reductase
MNQDKINQSLKIVSEAQQCAKEAETPLLVNFSGGKDSSAVLLLAKEVTDNIELIFMKSGLELPNTIEFVQAEADRLGLKLHITDPVRDYMGDFEYWVIRNGYFPAYAYTFCSSRLKIRPARAYLRKIYGHKAMYRMNGVRRQESIRRQRIYKQTDFIIPDGDLCGSFIVYPILEWTSEDVKDYLASKNFEDSKQYYNFGISGCAYCPYYEKEIYFRILSVYPHIYDHIIEMENRLNQPNFFS